MGCGGRPRVRFRNFTLLPAVFFTSPFCPSTLNCTRGAHNKLRRLERAAQFGAADVFVGRRIDDEIVLLVLLLFAGGAHGLQIFEGRRLDQCWRPERPWKVSAAATAQARCFVEYHRFPSCAPILISGPHKFGAEGQQQ